MQNFTIKCKFKSSRFKDYRVDVAQSRCLPSRNLFYSKSLVYHSPIITAQFLLLDVAGKRIAIDDIDGLVTQIRNVLDWLEQEKIRAEKEDNSETEQNNAENSDTNESTDTKLEDNAAADEPTETDTPSQEEASIPEKKSQSEISSKKGSKKKTEKPRNSKIGLP